MTRPIYITACNPEVIKRKLKDRLFFSSALQSVRLRIRVLADTMLQSPKPYTWQKIPPPDIDDESPVYIIDCAIIKPNDSDMGVLNFDENKDAAFCVGVDKYGPDFAVRDKTIENDAIEMEKMFTSELGLKSDRVKLSIATWNYEECTKESLHVSFTESAKKVEEKGNFIFYYAGHAFESAKESAGSECILSTANFSKSDRYATGISGDDLVQWLIEAECKASNVFFIFDCCFAGHLGKTLTSNPALKISAHASICNVCL